MVVLFILCRNSKFQRVDSLTYPLLPLLCVLIWTWHNLLHPLDVCRDLIKNSSMKKNFHRWNTGQTQCLKFMKIVQDIFDCPKPTITQVLLLTLYGPNQSQTSKKYGPLIWAGVFMYSCRWREQYQLFFKLHNRVYFTQSKEYTEISGEKGVIILYLFTSHTMRITCPRL